MPVEATVSAIYRYPVKGLSPEPLAEAELSPGQTLPFDRAYAIENGQGRFDPQAPKYLAKINFLMLMRDERLATLETRFDEADHTLTILRAGKQVARGSLETALGRSLIEQFISAYMQSELRGAPKIVQAPGHSFSDVSAKCLHIVNLASVRELERSIGRPVDALRFRANLYVEGLPAWSELDWLSKRLAVGAGEVSVFDRTGRCEATNVDPASGVRDLAIPAHLLRTYGHTDFGVYAKVTRGARVKPGEPIGPG